MFQATRRRLALWYTTVTAVLLLLFASGVYWYVRSTLIERVDDTLNHVVEVVERSLVIEPTDSKNQQRVNVQASFRDNADSVEDDHIDIEWFSPTGKLLWSTLSAPLDIPLHPNRTGETVRVVRSEEIEQNNSELRNASPLNGGNPRTRLAPPNSELLLRQVTERVQIGRQVLGYLRVSHPWFEVTKPTQRLIVDLVLGTTLMLISVALCGWFLSGKAIEPVRESYQHLKQFTADASHELRSPITLIQTNVQVALTDPDLQTPGHTSRRYQQQLKVVERLTQRLGRLVDDLLFLARQDGGIVRSSFLDCPLDALLMEVIEEQQLAAAEKNITLTLNLIDPPAETDPKVIDKWFTLQGDWNQLARLFTNLIGNALQYTPPGGQVKVELRRTGSMSHDQTRRYGTPQLQIDVSDTGIGIPESALLHLFDRFYRVDPARTHAATTPAAKTVTGSGLGLAIAAAIVKHHRGQIQVESTLHQCTTFTVTLPLSRWAQVDPATP